MLKEPPEYDYVAYIDGSGDPRLRKVKPRTPGGASEWFIVSAVLIPPEKEADTETWIADIMTAMNRRQMTDIHFAKLNDSRKSLACSMLAERHIRHFTIISKKLNMEGYKTPLPRR